MPRFLKISDSKITLKKKRRNKCVALIHPSKIINNRNTKCVYSTKSETGTEFGKSFVEINLKCKIK